MDKIRVHLGDGYRTTAEIRGHSLHADMPEDGGGTDTAMTSEEMLLAALGSCIAQTTKLYAARKGWPLEAVDITLEMERFNAGDYADYEGDANFVHEFREDIKFWGPLDEDQLVRLREIASKCPVRRAISTPSFFKDLDAEPAAK